MDLYFVVLIMLWVSISMLVTVFILGRKGKRSRIVERLEEIKGSGLQKTVVFEEKKRGNVFIYSLISCGRLISPKRETWRKAIDRELNAAGIYSERAMHIFLGVRVLLPVMLTLMSVLPTLLMKCELQVVIAAGICSVLVGIFTPLMFLRFFARRRKREIMRGFPDALDLLAVCTEAGIGFDAAIKKVAEEMALTNRHISKEFMSYIYEPQIGIPRHEALRNLAERIDIDIIKSFVTLLIQSDKLGTSIANTLRVYSDSLRTKRRQEAEIKAARLPVLIIFPLLFLIFPTLYIVILGPAVITISRSIIGNM